MKEQQPIYPLLVDSLDKNSLKQSYINQQSSIENQQQNKLIPKKKKKIFRIMTYNVYGFRLFKNSSNEILKIVGELEPDIANFQEFNTHFYMDGYKQFYKETMINENLGLATLCKTKWNKWTQYGGHNINKTSDEWRKYKETYDIGGIDSDKRGFIHIKVPIVKNNKVMNINIINTHLDVWDETANTRYFEINNIVQFIEKHKLINVILLGDLNDINLKLLPETLQGELQLNFKKRFKELGKSGIPKKVFQYLYKVGFVDSYELTKKPSPLYSCWTSRKVDHILIYKPTWNLEIDGLYIHYNNYSDHLPLIIDLKI